MPGATGSTLAREPTRVAFLTRHDRWPWLSQTEDGRGRHGILDVRMGLEGDARWIVVCDDLAGPIPTTVPREQRVLLLPEPPEIKSYPAAYLDQFGHLFSAVRQRGYRGHWIQSHTGLPWFHSVEFLPGGGLLARRDLASLRAMGLPPDKSSRLSIVCSTKSMLVRHKQRVRLIERLERAFPDLIDVFGNGYRPIATKADAIDPYRYHIVLENTETPHFWTEKLADAYLGYALPLFSGCTNVTAYFDARSLIRLPDIADTEAVVACIADVLARDPYEAYLDAIRAARTRLIEEHNVFAMLARLIAATPEHAPLAGPEMLRNVRQSKGAMGLVRHLAGRIRTVSHR